MLLNCPSINEWHKNVPSGVRKPVVFGFALLVAWAGGFGLWAATAPLDGAVVSSGAFVAVGQNKKIQHFEGGIIDEILVREGQLVEEGEVMLRLEETAARTKLRRLIQRKHRLLVKTARLEAERLGETTFELGPELIAMIPTEEREDLRRGEEIELTARLELLEAEIDVLDKEVAGLEESILGYEAQIDATRRQLEFFREEVADKQQLMDQSLIRKSDLLALQRAESRLAGELGQLISRVADSRERIARARQEMVKLRTAAVQRAVEELRMVEDEIEDIEEQVNAAEDVVDRLEIRAPVPGVVVQLDYHTAGGVIAPAATILELLPVNEELLIETVVDPTDISHLAQGQRAQIKLNALNHRLVPMVEAEVTYVSADAIQELDPRKAALNPTAAAGAYVVRVQIDERDLAEKAPDFQPVPGMPADVFIKTGQRTFFQYLMQPLIDSFSRAFREA